MKKDCRKVASPILTRNDRIDNHVGVKITTELANDHVKDEGHCIDKGLGCRRVSVSCHKFVTKLTKCLAQHGRKFDLELFGGLIPLHLRVLV